MEAALASGIASAFAPKIARMAPYTIGAGLQFNKENWKVTATVSHAAWGMVSKMVDK